MQTKVAVPVLLFLLLCPSPPVQAGVSREGTLTPTSLGGLLLPRADGLDRGVFSGTLVSVPPTFLVQYGRPIGRFTAAASAGVGILPDLIATGLLIWHPVRPTASRCGLGLAGYWGGILGPSNVDLKWDDAGIYGAHAILSTPVRRARAHVGAGVAHVFHPLGQGAGVLSLMAEVGVGSGLLTGEVLFIRPFEDTVSGGRFHGLALLGAHLPSGRAVVHIGAGVLLLNHGGWNDDVWPAPPILSVTVPFEPRRSD